MSYIKGGLRKFKEIIRENERQNEVGG